VRELRDSCDELNTLGGRVLRHGVEIRGLETPVNGGLSRDWKASRASHIVKREESEYLRHHLSMLYAPRDIRRSSYLLSQLATIDLTLAR
jgi:hypothetical protein